ncbi:MAG: hypothetical protein Q9213_007843, partial [Squamulea squamosa]
MNWTGGSLSRSRKQNANISVIQKKHFARARGKLLNGRPPPQPIDISIFEDVKTDDTVPRSTTTAPHLRRERPSTQMTLEEYEGLRPVVEQLQSLRPRHSSERTPQSHCFQSCSRLRSSEYHQAKPLQRLKANCHGSTGIQGLNVKGARSNAARSTSPPIYEGLDAKRRELLGTFDWVGLEKMKPVRMKFANTEDRDLIGKRRVVKSTHGSETLGMKQYRRPLINAHEKLNMMRANSRLLSSPGKISIHIGSAHRSSSAGHRRTKNSDRGDNQQALTSDEMLFDDQGSFKAAMGAPASSQNALFQSTSNSDEMLFDRVSSHAASQLYLEPSATDQVPYRRPSHATNRRMPYNGRLSAHTITSGSESGYSPGTREAEEASDERQPHRKSPDGARLQRSDELAVPELSHFGDKELVLGYRPPLEDGHKVSTRQTTGSPFCSTSTQGDECHPTHTTTQKLTKASPSAKFSRVPTALVKHWQANTGSTEAIPKRSHKDLLKPQNAGNELRRIERPTSVTKAPTPRSLEPPKQDIDWNQGAPDPAIKPSAPVLSPITEQTNEPKLPAGPTPEEEEELLWRKFVFGTEDPAKGWTLEEPVTLPPKAQKTNTSSPLQPVFSTNHNVSDTNNSPITQTQPSLLVEASSSTPSPFPSHPPNLPH